MRNLSSTSRTWVRFVSIGLACSLLLSLLARVQIITTTVKAQSQGIVFDHVASSTAINNATSTTPTLSWSHPTGTGANRILIVTVSTNGHPALTNRVTSVTCGTAPLSRLGTVVSTDQQSAVEMFELLAPPSGTNTITVNLMPLSGATAVGGSISFSGVNQRSPLRRQQLGLIASNTGIFQPNTLVQSKSPNVRVISGNSDVIVDTVATSAAGGSFTANSPQAERWAGAFVTTGISLGGGSAFKIGAGSTRAGAGPATSTSWTMTGLFSETGTSVMAAPWAIGAISLIPASAPTIPSPTPTPLPSPPRFSAPGLPPGPNLPNLDVVRKLQSVTPVIKPGGPMTAAAPICDVGDDCGGCPECGGPPTPNDPGYSTPRTQPQNRTGQPGITLGSRNFNWSASLVSLSGRAGLDLNLTLTYNSLVWVFDNGQIKFNADEGFPGPGFRLGFPIVQPRFQNAETGIWSYLMITPSGGRVEMRQVSTNIYESYDGSYTQLTDPGDGTLTVRTSDGTQFGFTNGGANCTQIEDRNGNKISIDYNGNVPSTVTDTVGRVLTFNYMNGFLSSITQGGKTWASFNYNSILFSYNYPGLQVNAPPNNSLLAVPTQVNVEDGSSYQFTYNSWGQVSQITHVAPDGQTTLNYVSYNLPADASNPQSDCPRFTERHEFAKDWNGGAEAITQLGIDSDGGQVMITPDGTRYKELANGAGFANGLPSREEWWSGGVRQKWVTYSWTQDNPALGYPVNPRLVDTTVSDLNGNQRRSSIGYSSFAMPSGSSCSLPSDVIEYAADATTTLRRTHTDYNLDGAYLGRNIIGLVSNSYVYDGSGAPFSRTDFHYDETGLQDPPGIVQHDGNYNTGFVQGRGNLTSATRFNVFDQSQSATSSVAYNTAGSPVSSTDAAGHTNTISYVDSNGGSSFAYPTQVNDGDGNATVSQYNYDMGLLTVSQTPPPQGFTQGPIVTRQYDSVRRLVQVTNNVNGATTTFMYDANLAWVEQFATIQDGAGSAFSIQVLDGAGRVRAIAHDHPTGTSGPTPYSGSFIIYDNMGRVAQASNAAETNSSVDMTSQWIASGDDAANGWIYTTQAYDWKGRPTVTTNPDGTTRVLSYGGCGCAGGEIVTAQDEAGRLRRTTADAVSRLAKVEELDKGGNIYSTTNYAYDVLDHLTGINQQGLTRSFGFDGFGRLQTRTTPEQGTTNYSYFADDTVQTVTDARGASSSFTYNGRHLVTAISYGVPAGVAATANVTFGYDAAGNRNSMNDGLGSVSYNYDQLSRLTSETRNINGFNPLTLSYGYNLAGELTGITNPWGVQVGYGYDKIGEITNVSGAGYAGVSTYASGITYRAFGAMKGLTYGNGLTLSTAYDIRLRLTNLTVSNVQAYNYSYLEQTGRVNYARSLDDSTLDRSYEYDDQGRLLFAHSGAEARAALGIDGQPWGTMDGPYSLGFSYDQFGNMTQRYGWGGEVQGGGAGQTSFLNYSYTNNRQDGFSYDAAGNLTNDLGQTFTYDATGQQTNASYMSVEQSYDGDGLRVRKVENGTTTYYLRSTVLGGQVVAELDAYGNWTRGYVYQGSGLLAVQQGNAVWWMHQDPITKSKRTTDGFGNMVSAIELDPWGADTNRSWNPAFQPKKFTSYERDANGSDEAMFRRYNRWHSRFDQPDPYHGSYDLDNPQSLNRYTYTKDDPVNLVDPNGLDDSPPDCGPGTAAMRDDNGDWQCVGTGVSVVTVTGSWDDMSDYLPNWTSDNFNFLIVLLQDPIQQGGTILHEIGHLAPPDRPHCGVNPVTGRPGFTANPRGVPGNLRPGVGGGGQFHAPRRGDPIGHQGLDISGTTNQSPVYANRAGTITFSGPTRGMAGNLVIIDHGGGVTTRYAHLSSFAGFVAGDSVDEGDEIGVLGQTGNARRLPASEAHVHFGVQVNGQNVNPATYLNSPCPP